MFCYLALFHDMRDNFSGPRLQALVTKWLKSKFGAIERCSLGVKNAPVIIIKMLKQKQTIVNSVSEISLIYKGWNMH